MTELLTAAQMRAIEQAAIESGEVTGLELMERAGQGVVEAIFEEWPELDTPGKRAVVLCGPGNNGGDGFVVARLLKKRGWEVEVFLYGDPAKLPPDAKENYERWLGGNQVDCSVDGDEGDWSENAYQEAVRADLVIDALFGIGLSRPISGELRYLIGRFGEKRRYFERLVSIDVPSGLCSDSGACLGDPRQARSFGEDLVWGGVSALAAHMTVTFDSPKVGHFLEDGSSACGIVKVVDIGVQQYRATEISKNSLHRVLREPDVELLCQTPLVQDKRPFFSRPWVWAAKSEGHKFWHGHALILTGGSGKTGAARLSARGALRIGAGLVTLGVPPSAQQEVACQITALMLQRVADAEALTKVLEDSRLNALCLGPGMGLDRARELVPATLAAKRATVLDADSLSAFGEAPEDLFAMLHENCVLTPHGGEFARLFPDIAEKLNAPATKGPAYSKVDATREAAARAGCVVLFKGADTVIAAPNGRCSVNAAHYDRAAPWLATAGSGDVLAGFITGLLARGFAPMQAAESAAWLHVECALEFGPGLIAEDLPEQIPAVFRKLGL
ncbi:NAD(P)H-hydrate dehydratase [Phycobacter sp. K97]|uniref:NAD(P)H-hydrate dehydratase n=1 Tax=Phycobacter sedimenti TaxID=3133977 RepID=UPI00311E0AD7